MVANWPKPSSLSLLPAWPLARYHLFLRSPFVFKVFSIRPFLSYFWPVSTFPKWRLNRSQYLTLPGFSHRSQQVSSKSLFPHSLCFWAGGKKRHRNNYGNDCCYNDYDDYRRRRRRSALERGPLLDTLEDRGGRYRKVRTIRLSVKHPGVEEEMQKAAQKEVQEAQEAVVQARGTNVHKGRGEPVNLNNVK